MKTIDTIIVVLGIMFFLWIGLSWIDVIADNLSFNPTHSAWNLFNLLIGD